MIKMKSLEYRMKAWRGSFRATSNKESVWFNDLDFKESGFITFVALSVEKNVDYSDFLSILYKNNELIETVITEYCNCDKAGKELCIEAVLLPKSKKYAVINVLPLIDNGIEGFGVILDLENPNEYGIIHHNYVNSLWQEDLENWKLSSKLLGGKSKEKKTSNTVSPDFEIENIDYILSLFESEIYGYFAKWQTDLFCSKQSIVEVNLSDGLLNEVEPTNKHAESLIWLQFNRSEIQNETYSVVREKLHFSESEVSEIKLVGITLHEGNDIQISLLFVTEKFDYDEHGLEVKWANGQVVYCGHQI